ncbi:MAG: ADOP family duplicated permease [Vicinamibacterales bacterium]
MVTGLVGDVRHGVRHLRRSPGFALAAVLTLALGIGANVAIATILNALVMRPLPIPDPDGLIGISGRGLHGEHRLTLITAIAELERGESPFREVCGYNGGVVIAVEANRRPTQASGAMVTGRCFETFGVTPALGRPITGDDAPLTRSGRPVVVISHRFWHLMFDGDPGVIGRSIRAEGTDLMVVGVLPPGFGGLHVDSDIDVFFPFDTILPAPPERRPGASHILARLRDGVSMEQAAAALEAQWPAVLTAIVPMTLSTIERQEWLGARLRIEHIGTGISLLRDWYASPLKLVAGLSTLLLLATCINLGGLFLARLSARAPELAVRAALGGSRWRLAQPVLVEGVLMAVGGTLLAGPVAVGLVAPLVSYFPSGVVERTLTFAPDPGVLIATALAGLTAGLLASALPGRLASRQHVGSHGAGARIAGAVGHGWARAYLVAQVAISVVLLVAATLLIRSLYLLQRADGGVRTDGIVVGRLMPVPNGYAGLDDAAYYPSILSDVARVPGVRTAGFAALFPYLQHGFGMPFAVTAVGEPRERARAILETVSPGFFETLGVPLLAGRPLTWRDDSRAPDVAIVSESLARVLDGAANAIGHHVRIGTNRRDADVTIVGVVAALSLGDPRDTTPLVVYRPLLQTEGPGQYPTLALAIDGDQAPVIERVRRVVARAGHEYVHDVARLDRVLTSAPAGERMSALLAGSLALIAVVMVFVGIYGVLAHAVSQRTREIGVRTAVGANPSAIVALIVRDGLAVTVAGLALGLPMAALGARALKALLFGVSETHALTYVGATIGFVTLGLVASLVPARRAARIDPVSALRTD